MGNRRSSPAWSERQACAAAAASSRTISERDAWDIALAWHAPLFGYVQVDTGVHHLEDLRFTSREIKDPSAEEYTIVQHIEWLEFQIHPKHRTDAEHRVRALRAAVIAWFALTCCPGFNVYENPVFWRRVFSAIQRRGPTPSDLEDAGMVSDRERFFETRDRVFPAIRLKWFDGFPLEILWETETERPRTVHEKTLKRVLKKLRPFVSPVKWRRAIPLSIRLDTDTASSESVEMFSTSLQHLDLRHRTCRVEPSFHLVQVLCFHTNIARLAPMVTALTDAKLIVSETRSCEVAHTIKHAMASLAALQLGQCDPNHTMIRQLNLCRSRNPGTSIFDPFDHFAQCCSALPHQKNIVQSLRSFDGEFMAPLQFTPTNAAWLGYALFHPDTADHNTSAENLTLNLIDRHQSSLPSLRYMAIGNNLLYAMGLSTVLTTAYYHARVRVGTLVCSRAYFDGKPDEILYTFTSELWITLCSIPERDDAAFRGHSWVCIVLPGHGLGWIRSRDILEVVCRPAAPCCVRKLHVLPSTICSQRLTETVLLDALSILGDRLIYLHAGSSPLSVEAVQSLLRLCPNLESLRIPHDGSYWSDADAISSTRDHPRLRELELTITKPFVAFATIASLRHLCVLRIQAPDKKLFAANRAAVESVLERYPTLQYFCWQWKTSGIHYNPTWDDTVHHGLAHADRARFLPLSGDKAQVPFRREARLAFLSVLGHPTNQTSSMAKLPPDVLQLICSFSSSSARRQLYIKDRYKP